MISPNRWNLWRLDAASLAVIAGLTAIAYFGQISPAISRHEQACAQNLQLGAEQTQSMDLERSLNSMQEKLNAAQQTAAASQLTLQSATELNHRLADLTELAGRFSLTVETIESGATVHLDRYSTVAIRISGRGTYRNCASMLRQVRSAMPDIGVVSMEMTSIAVSSDAIATFVFELNWHTQPQPRPTKK